MTECIFKWHKRHLLSLIVLAQNRKKMTRKSLVEAITLSRQIVRRFSRHFWLSFDRFVSCCFENI